MKWSLRRTLAVRSAATIGVGLAVAAAAAYTVTGRVLRKQLDQGLGATAFLASDRLPIPGAPTRTEPALATDQPRFAREVNRYVALRDSNGTVAWTLPRSVRDLPLDTAAFREAQRGGAKPVDQVWHGEAIRSLYTTPSSPVAGNHGVIQVAAALEPIATVQRDLGALLLALVLLGTTAAFVGAWWLAGSAVRPVLEIAEQAGQIAAGASGHRIVAHATWEEYRGLVIILNVMLDRLDTAFRNQRRLTADVGHELRTPLTALRGEIEVALRAERAPTEYREVLHSALEEVHRLSEMTEDLLLMTRADGQLLSIERAPTDLNDVVDDALKELGSRIEERGLVIERSLAQGGAVAPVDRALVARAIHQLLDNAVKFTPPNGTVRVTTVPPDGRGLVRFSVEDSGPGIAPEDLPHIFEPFYRADQARSRGSGTGLGLAMVAALIRLQGGTVQASNVVRDSARTGARVEVTLPASPGDN